MCLKDLRDRFAKIPVSVSKPLVSFRESIANFKEEDSEELDASVQIPKIIEGKIASRVVSFRLKVIPLTLKAAQLIDKHKGLIKRTLN